MRYVHNGGSLLATFESGFYDENGDPADRGEWLAFLGLEKVEGCFIPAGHEEYMLMRERDGVLMPRTYNALQTVPVQGSEVLGYFMNPTGGPYAKLSGASEYPAWVVSKRGKGKVVYSAGTLFESIGRFHLDDHLDLFKSALELLSKDSRLQIETDAPGSLAMELRKNGSQTLLHLVNATGDMKRPIGKIVPLKDVEVSAKIRKTPRSVRSVVGGKKLNFEYSDGRVRFLIPEIEAYELVVFE